MALAPDRNSRKRWLVAGALAFAASTLAPAAPTLVAAASTPQAVVVRGQSPGCTDAVASDVAALGGRVTRRLDILGGGSALLPAGAASALSTAPCVAQVTPDGTLTPESIGGYNPTQDTGSLYNTTRIIGAQAAWRQGYTGKGVGVALIDTGVAPVQGLNAPGQVVNGPDLSFDSQTPALTDNDEYGHGTHMAGIIAGNDLFGQPAPASGAARNSSAANDYAGNTDAFIGVAPDAHIVNLKVGDENGVVDVSQVIAAIDWVVQHANDHNLNIRVINLSYGTQTGQAYTLDPLAFAAEVAWQNGIVVVAAAGNAGNSSDGLNDPAYDPFLIAVGAADTNGTNSKSDDTVASFSSSGDGTRNPDLVAPGVHIESLRDPGSNIDDQYGSTATVGGRFFLGSGTSQATAVVSGAVADYLSANSWASPDQVKRALMSGATSLSQPATLQGAGELDLSNALNAKTNHSRQGFTPSTGTGTLEAARGGLHVVSNGVALTGEQDIFGNAWNSASMAQLEQSSSAWSGGAFNGTTWASSAWSSAGWSSVAWSSSAWSGATWSSAGWSSAGWSSAGWSSAGWSGAGWSSSGWSTAGWSTAGWSDYSWS